MSLKISKHIFRAYDIRGLYNRDITPEIFHRIGLATGEYIKNVIGGKHVTVGNDIRPSSDLLVNSLISGISSIGVDVIFTKTTSLGQTLFRGWELKQDLILFVTASHLPPEWNGIKFYYGDGVGLPEEELMKIRDLTLSQDFDMMSEKDWGNIQFVDAKESYQNFFKSRFAYNKKLRIALDCGGGSMTLSAPEIFTVLGIDIESIYCKPDPLFSNRPSDPKPENLTTLIEKIQESNCDFGVAFDGDGDRAVMVDNTGNILSADKTGIILGKYGLTKKSGTVIVNVECSKVVKEQLEPLGFTIKQIKVGHTFLTLEAKKENSPLGIESSGHIILPEYFLFDDALVIPFKIAEILDKTQKTLGELASDIPTYPIRKEEIDCPDEIKFEVINRLKDAFSKEFEKINTMDGIRVELNEGWVLLRPSNTSPLIRLTVEADNDTLVNQLTTKFIDRTTEVIENMQ